MHYKVLIVPDDEYIRFVGECTRWKLKELAVFEATVSYEPVEAAIDVQKNRYSGLRSRMSSPKVVANELAHEIAVNLAKLAELHEAPQPLPSP